MLQLPMFYYLPASSWAGKPASLVQSSPAPASLFFPHGAKERFLDFLTPLESALAKTSSCKFFRIRTYKKARGRRDVMLTNSLPYPRYSSHARPHRHTSVVSRRPRLPRNFTLSVVFSAPAALAFVMLSLNVVNCPSRNRSRNPITIPCPTRQRIPVR